MKPLNFFQMFLVIIIVGILGVGLKDMLGLNQKDVATTISAEDYGVSPDGAFWFKADLVKGGHILLVIPETDSTKFKSSLKVSGYGYVREIIRMQKDGDYYFAKPTPKNNR